MRAMDGNIMVVNEYFDAQQDAASNSCPTCGINSIMHDHNTGETVCTNCGLVISSDAIDLGKEWSAYDLAESTMKERAGPSLMGKHREVMYTNFSIQKDGQGRTLPQSQQNRTSLWESLPQFLHFFFLRIR